MGGEGSEGEGANKTQTSGHDSLSHTNFVWHVDMEKHVSNATFHVNRG